MNIRRLLALLVTLLAIPAIAGCGSADMTSGEIITAVIEAAADIETFEFDAEIEQSMLLKNGESFEMETHTTIAGTVDQLNREMKQDIKTTTAGLSGEGEAEVTAIEQYIIGEAMYTRMDYPFTGPVWIKQTMPEDYWREASSLERQLEMLELAEINVTGSETVSGTKCYALRMNLPPENIRELMAAALGLEGLDEMPDFADIIKNLSIKLWVAKDTFFPVKAEMKIKMVITPEDMGETSGEAEGEMTVEMETTFKYRNYNQSVSIVLPEEASDAIEMPFL